MYVVLQFLTDFVRICFKMCISTVRKTCTRWIFDFLFWGFFGGKKLKKIPQKSPQISFFLVSQPIWMKFGTR